MPDPVVSPADTPEELGRKISAALAWIQDPFGSAPNRDRQHATVSLAALLAVGERDKAALVQAGEEIATLTDAVLKCQRAGERDRRHIARLRESLSRLSCAVVSENFSRPAGSPAMSSNLRVALDNAAIVVRETPAVLAGEEDAGNG